MDTLYERGDETRGTASRKALVITSSSSTISNHYNSSRNQCPYCKETHYVNQCPQFLALDVPSRINFVTRYKHCFNCLGSIHILPNCRSSNCRTCKGKHQTLLHLPQITLPSTMETLPPETENPSINLCTNTDYQVANAALERKGESYMHTISVILSTSQVIVKDKNNQTHMIRALLDSGSQSNFITKQVAEKLDLPTQNIDLEVLGFNESVTKITKLWKLKIQSKDSTYSTSLSCFIVPNICKLPTQVTNNHLFSIPNRFELADESFYQGGHIDMIIGAESFYQLLCVGQQCLGDDLPILQRTRLGWVVSGVITNTKKIERVRCNFISHTNIQNFMSSGEDMLTRKLPNDDYKQCGQVFKNHTRDSDGKFVVELPLKLPVSSLGQSRSVVYKRFMALESKFARDTEYKQRYVQFIRDFINTGHMIKVDNATESCNYLPHHAVVNLQKTTTPLRVVFDASIQTNSGRSLNDIQHKGAIEQDDLVNILLRFRKHKFVINANITKFYRMIYISPSQQHLQCVLWRENRFEPLHTYKLTTLSFGLKSAPYIATRCLRQLADECRAQIPIAANARTSDFYIDDYLHGSDDEQTLTQTAIQIDKVLRRANFILTKWKSNSPNILRKILSHDETGSNTKPTALTTNPNNTNKVIGLSWCSSSSDNILYMLNVEPVPTSLTKRRILSMTSAIFDPLGLLEPVIIIAKCFIQRLWRT